MVIKLAERMTGITISLAPSSDESLGKTGTPMRVLRKRIKTKRPILYIWATFFKESFFGCI